MGERDLSRPKVIDMNKNMELYPESPDENLIAEKIRGNTLKVYYLLADSPNVRFGVREIQRALEFGTPSLASYHLNRLLNFELIDKTESGQYFVRERNPVLLGELADHIRVADHHVPKLLIYLILSFFQLIGAVMLYLADVSLTVFLIYVIVFNSLLIGLFFRDIIITLNKIL